MVSSTCLLALLLMFFVQGLAVVARVRMSQTQYVVREQSRICLDVINELGPASEAFSVSFSYSTILMGRSDSLAGERTDLLFFLKGEEMSEVCFNHEDDILSCEPNITGTVKLTSTSTSQFIVNSTPATVTIQDDDYVYASFEKAQYTFTEGSSSNEKIIVNTTCINTIQLEIQGNMVEGSIRYPTEIFLTEQSQDLMLSIDDDEIALETPETAVLELGTSLTWSPVMLSPLQRTTIFLYDDDVVTVKLTSTSGTVEEGLGYQVCISISGPIARQLDVLLHIVDGTADISDLETVSDSIMVTFTPLSDEVKCIVIVAVQDSVIEGDESFIVVLSVETNLPASIQDNLHIGTSVATITIEDSSGCTNILINPVNTKRSDIYVLKNKALCFFCTTCSSEVSWNLTSHLGRRWEGKTGENLTDIGSVLPNGTLLIINSSLVFTGSNPGILMLTDLQALSQNSSKYNIHEGDEAEITHLSITCNRTKTSVKLTCIYRGAPQPEITWYADSQPVQHQEILSRVDTVGSETYQSILFVNRTIAADFNTHMCKATNIFAIQTLEVDTSQCHDNAATDHVNSGPMTTAHSLIACTISMIISMIYL